MTELPARYVRLAAYVAHQEIARRQRFGIPIPQWLRDVDMVLHRPILSDPGQHPRQIVSGTEQWETATKRARRLGVHPRTIRRHANRHGGRKTGQFWVFPRDEEGIRSSPTTNCASSPKKCSTPGTIPSILNRSRSAATTCRGKG